MASGADRPRAPEFSRLTALVTGASSGIGREMSLQLAAAGHHLILVDKQEAEVRAFRDVLSQQFPGVEVQVMVADLARQDAAETLYERLDRPVEILVNNAGFGNYGDFTKNDWVRESQMILLHIYTLTHLTKLLLPGMLEQPWGRILNVASIAGFQPSPYMAVYHASKAYVLSFSEALSEELRHTNVKVTVLCPGVTPTGFTAAVGQGRPELANNNWLATPAKMVAQKGLEGMFRGQTVVIPGKMNFLLANVHRFLPRSMVVRIARKVQERNRRTFHQNL